MAAEMNRTNLGLGACFALTHASQLLEDAAILYASRRSSSSLHLAIMAREELGRYHLLSARRNSLADDQTVDAKEIAKSLNSHTTKLLASNFVFAVPFAPGQEAAWRAAIERNDEGAAQRISSEIRDRATEHRSREVVALHQRRLKAQYVDVDSNTGQWSRPSDILLGEPSSLIRCVMTEICNALIASQSSTWIHESFGHIGEGKPEMGPFSHRVFAYLAQGDG